MKAALAAARHSPVMGPAWPWPLWTGIAATIAASAARGRRVTPAEGPRRCRRACPSRGNEVNLVSFGDGTPGTGTPVPKGNTVFTDSATYLPPNSIAVAKVIVGVDASASVQSQSDPLPVVLRITGPARSVYENGRLLTTNITGCLVNGAARGDLSSEKVYVKLQRMTCPQPGGRYA